MDEINPYAAPTSDLSSPSASVNIGRYHTVSGFKLVVMSVCTFGIFLVYWMYKNWRMIADRDESKIMPFWRAVFGAIWLHALCKYVNNDAQDVEVGPPLSGTGLAIGFFLINFVPTRLPTFFWMFSLLSFAFILPINALMHKVNLKVDEKSTIDGSFSAGNIGFVILGGTLLTFSVIGTLML